MKKFIITLVITAMAAMMIPVGASAVTFNKVGDGVYAAVIGCDENVNVNDMVCDIPQISISGINCPEQDDVTSETPEQDCVPGADCTTEPDTNVPEQDTDIPEQEESAPEQAPEQDNNAPDQTPEQDTNTPTEDSSLHEYEAEVIRLVNEIRVQNGLKAFETDTELSRVARIKSQDMKDNNYFSHTSPTYGSPFDMMKQFGISYRTAGENIAKGQRTPQAVVDGWMNSDGHRANILNASYTHIGVGYVADGNYWTQMFVGR